MQSHNYLVLLLSYFIILLVLLYYTADVLNVFLM